LSEAECHARLEHARSINEIGSCQSRKQRADRLFVSCLGIGYLCISLPTGDIAWYTVEIR
jgi:hypothetical protein